MGKCLPEPFQFLNGTIKSNVSFGEGVPVDSFQFLNGTIKSNTVLNPDNDLDIFQFLNGTIKRNNGVSVGSETCNFNSSTVRLKVEAFKDWALSQTFQFLNGTIKSK